MAKSNQILESLKKLYEKRTALDAEIVELGRQLISDGERKVEKPGKPAKGKSKVKAKAGKGKDDAVQPVIRKPRGRKPAEAPAQ